RRTFPEIGMRVGHTAFKVEFLAPCAAPCATGERRCPRDEVCYEGLRYCDECERGDDRRCACVTPQGPDKPDGTRCDFLRGDLAYPGECSSGKCVAKP